MFELYKYLKRYICLCHFVKNKDEKLYVAAVDIALPEFQRAIYKVICIKENLK